MKKYAYDYNICTVDDETVFRKQCVALEKHIPSLEKGKTLDDVDGSTTQIYTLSDKEILVHNSVYVGAVYIESEIPLEPFFEKHNARTAV